MAFPLLLLLLITTSVLTCKWGLKWNHIDVLKLCQYVFFLEKNPILISFLLINWVYNWAYDNLSTFPLANAQVLPWMQILLVGNHCITIRVEFADGNKRMFDSLIHVSVSVCFLRRWIEKGTPSPIKSIAETAKDISHCSRSKCSFTHNSESSCSIGSVDLAEVNIIHISRNCNNGHFLIYVKIWIWIFGYEKSLFENVHTVQLWQNTSMLLYMCVCVRVHG